MDSTPLHSAVRYHKPDKVRQLLTSGDCNVNSTNFIGQTALDVACIEGYIDIVEILISFDIHSGDNSIPLHTAALNGHTDIVRTLINKYNCSSEIKGLNEMTLLHQACIGGHIEMIEVLISEFKCTPMAHDKYKNTPLHIAALFGQEDVARLLITKYNCQVDCKNCNNKTPLHNACRKGHLSVVRMLISEFKSDVDARDNNNHTPLHEAALNGHTDIVRAHINEFNCSSEVKGVDERTLLHRACAGGQKEMVEVLISEFKCTPMAHDKANSTPLHIAALCGQEEVARLLITKYNCQVDCKDCINQTPLHYACQKGHLSVVRMLISEFKCDLIAHDVDGDTCLHTACFYGHHNIVYLLLYEYDAPVFVFNKSGKSALDMVGSEDVRQVIMKYLSERSGKIRSDYDKLQSLALKRFSGQKPLLRIFVIGHAGAGKSSLVKAFQRDGFFSSFSSVSEKTVPPHTAGIIPSDYTNSDIGRVVFYDFAGDNEYYSSHAAIMERLMCCEKGLNIFIFVCDLTNSNERLKERFGFWLSFIGLHCRSTNNEIEVISVGSHVDQLEQDATKSKLCYLDSVAKNFIKDGLKMEFREALAVDCRKPKDVKRIRDIVQTLSLSVKPVALSPQASIILGLLEYDFSSVVVCTMKSLMDHIKQTGVCMLKDCEYIYSIVKELHSVGVLIIIQDKDHNPADCLLLLKPSALTNDLHKSLFSKPAMDKLRSGNPYFGQLGILTKAALNEVVPKYIPISCLLQLQYCHEFKHFEVHHDFTLTPSSETAPSESLLFFPALCNRQKPSLVSSISDSTSIGWYMKCVKEFDYLPSRFLHVLLLRLAFCFTLTNHQPGTSSDEHSYSRRCDLWTNGVRWLTEDGVECFVEVVNEFRGVVVVTRSEMDCKENCTFIFERIVQKVLEAKAEYCCNISPEVYLLDPDELNQLQSIPDVEQMHLFSMKEVQSVILRGKQRAVSTNFNGRAFLDPRKLIFVNIFVFWNIIFPLDAAELLKLLEEIVNEWHNLGLQLGLTTAELKVIEIDYHSSVLERKNRMLLKWMSKSPSWCTLVKALRAINRPVLAKAIADRYNIHVQEKLHPDNPEFNSLPDDEFLESFASVVSSHWPSLASLLSFSTPDIEEMRRHTEAHPPHQQALHMLNQWRTSNGSEATYHQLHDRLKSISVLRQ